MKILSAFCALILTLAMLLSVGAAAADSYVVLYGFAFDINDHGDAVIHSYDGRSDVVSIPATLMDAPVAEIDNYAFFGYTGLKSISFDQAASLTRIGDSAFCNCTGLTGLSIPSGVELSFGTFQGCTGLGELSIGEGIDNIPSQCFYGCTGLENVVLPDSVTTIGERAFADCTGLKTVTIPASTVSIAYNAFDNCGDIVILCPKSSYAAEYAVEAGIAVRYTDAVYYLRGDADGDGKVTIMDVTCIQRYLAGYDVRDPEGVVLRGRTGEELNILDATSIQRWLADIDNPKNVGEYVELIEA